MQKTVIKCLTITSQNIMIHKNEGERWERVYNKKSLVFSLADKIKHSIAIRFCSLLEDEVGSVITSFEEMWF